MANKSSLTIKSATAPGSPEDVTTVVIEDCHGNPLVVVLALTNDTYFVTTVNEGADFQRALSALGINKVVIANKISGPPVPAGHKLLTGY